MSLGKHVADALAAYANGTLAEPRAAEVRAHLASCAACREELTEWESVARGARRGHAAAPAPAAAVTAAAWARIVWLQARGLHPGRGRVRRDLSLLLQVLSHQFGLARRALIAPPLLSAGLGLALAVLALRTGHAPAVFGVILSIGGALGGALCLGPDHEPSPDLAASLPVSARWVLAARLGLVFAVNVAAGLIASALLLALHGMPQGLWGVTDLWLGPMLALGAFSAMLAAIWGTVAATTGAIAVWAVRLFGGVAVATAWHTSVPILAAAALLAACALAVGQRIPRTA